MRVLQVSNLYPPHWLGGYERMACWSAEGLRSQGWEVDVLTGRGSGFARQPHISPRLDLDLEALVAAHLGEGIRFPGGVVEGLRRHVFSAANFSACRRLIRARRPALISFWNPAFITFSPLLAARFAGLPSVVHLSDVAANPFRNPHRPSFPPRGLRTARAAIDLVLRLSRPRRFVVPSQFLLRRLVEQEGLPEGAIEVIHWPVAPDVPDEPLRAPGGARTRILFVGSLAPEKGPEVLIEALHRARRVRPALSLGLAGGGSAPFVARLREMAGDAPVRFLGRLDRPELLRCYAEHDILAFPSQWDEPFGLVPLEALACGLPVVATPTGGTPEAIVHEVTGLVVPAGDAAALAAALVRLAEQPGLAAALAEEGRRHVREAHAFPAFVERLRRLYLGVAGQQERAA